MGMCKCPLQLCAPQPIPEQPQASSDAKNDSRDMSQSHHPFVATLSQTRTYKSSPYQTLGIQTFNMIFSMKTMAWKQS